MTRQDEDALRDRLDALERTLNGNGEMGVSQKVGILWKFLLAFVAILCTALGSLFNAFINGWLK